MKKIILMSFLSTLIFSPLLSAQKSIICGTTEMKAISERLIANKKAFSLNPITERSITYVPVKFHIIANDAGSGGVKETAVLDMLCGMNEFYASFGIQYYIKNGFDYMSSSSAAIDPQSSGGELQIKSKKVKQMVNIFLCQSFSSMVPGLLGYYTEGFPGYQNDFLVIKKSEVTKSSYTAEHEMGHFFSLLHPFNGWDENPYNPKIHGNPVNILFSPDNPQLPIEFADESNCQIAGDFLCDTPASYNFANDYWMFKGCSPMDTFVHDYHNQIVDPDEKNVMDYFADCTDYHFSTSQQNLIITDLTNRKATLGNNKINSTTTPNLNIITTNVLNPNIDSGKILSNYGDIKLAWKDIPGATTYIVEVDIASNFASPSFKSAIVNSSEWTVPGLIKNKKYYWRVYPFNEYSTCAGFSKTFVFTTGQWLVSTTEIKELNSWKIDPNPVSKNSTVSLELNSINAFNSDVIITDISGKIISNIKNIRIQEGAQSIEISTANLTIGMYIVQLRTGTGISTQKLLIQ
ncbi:MAG TPA: zinc-dependent metalloprotease [Saprospiraceae bacterium]|nr:zinc-dependent metalloprotease [Saprospiraceae bacterium]